MRRPSLRETLTGVAVMLVSLSIAVVLCELGLRALLPSAGDYYAHKPYLRVNFEPSPKIMPGIEGVSRYFVNSMGVRGDEFSHDDTYRILAIGGSTTECNYLDQSETWQFLLQEKLNKNTQNHKVWVGNVGKGGITSRHHILQMKYLLPQFEDIDAVIMLLGLNDLSNRLAQDIHYDPHSLDRPGSKEKQLLEAFSVLPVGHNLALPYYKRAALWHLGRKVKYRIFHSGHIQDRGGRYLQSWRRHRRNATTIRNELPDLSTALEEYCRNIDTIVDLARDKSVRIIFVTQPVLWRSGLPDELKNLLWFGGVGRYRQSIEREYYSVEALATGMDMYNETLLWVSRIRQVECFDLASCLVKDTTVFYDDCHFNEDGSERVAELLARYLLQREPFK